MMSLRRTLLDPFEVVDRAPASSRLFSIEEIAAWFEGIGAIEGTRLVSVGEPWGRRDDPIDRRWRARGWGDDIYE
jgi:hypothetical protein